MGVPDKFNFRLFEDCDNPETSGIIFSANGRESDIYEITWCDLRTGKRHVTYDRKSVEKFVKSGDWIIIEDEGNKGDEMMLKYEWPDRFEYVVNWSGKTYTAIKNETGLYNCYEQGSNKCLGFTAAIDQSVTTFEAALEAGAITVLTQLKKVSPKRSISIDVTSAHAAAKFDVANNPYKPTSSVPDAEREINLMIRNVYDRAMKQKEFEYISTGTGSWTVVFQPEDENYGTITVLVSPNVGAGYYDDALEYLEQVGA